MSKSVLLELACLSRIRLVITSMLYTNNQCIHKTEPSPLYVFKQFRQLCWGIIVFKPICDKKNSRILRWENNSLTKNPIVFFCCSFHISLLGRNLLWSENINNESLWITERKKIWVHIICYVNAEKCYFYLPKEKCNYWLIMSYFSNKLQKVFCVRFIVESVLGQRGWHWLVHTKCTLLCKRSSLKHVGLWSEILEPCFSLCNTLILCLGFALLHLWWVVQLFTDLGFQMVYPQT